MAEITKTKINTLKELIVDLENTIGNQCYNGNIQNYGSWGAWESQGREFKYPLNYYTNETKRKRKYLSNDMNADEIISAYYAFGANQLHIGKAVIRAIELIEQRYDLNFVEFEKAKNK
jgi:hypothetical protein